MKGNVFIAGGGTGGHFYPALAVSKELYDKGYNVFFIGTKNGIEASKDFPFGKKILLDITGIRGKSLSQKIAGIYSILKYTKDVRKLIKQHKPIFSLVFGGYTGVPLGLASFLTRTPLFIHEQNSIPSYTNQILSKFSKKKFYTFDYTKRFFKKNAIKSGMPLREKIKERLSLSKEEARKILGIGTDEKVILVFGGSQGTKIFGEIVKRLSTQMENIKFIMIKGKNVKTNFFEPNVISYDYFEDMGLLYKASDLVISRAGAGTVNELIAYGKFAIYIPYRYAASDHQYYNVRWLADKNLSKVVREEDLSIDRLKDTIQEILRQDLKKLEEQLKKYSVLNSEEIIIQEIENVIFKKA